MMWLFLLVWPLHDYSISLPFIVYFYRYSAISDDVYDIK